jgi:hypothetical protein
VHRLRRGRAYEPQEPQLAGFSSKDGPDGWTALEAMPTDATLDTWEQRHALLPPRWSLHPMRGKECGLRDVVPATSVAEGSQP